MSKTLTRIVAVVALAALPLAACGDDDEPTTTAPTEEAAGGIAVAGAWARTSPAVATAGAVYLQIANEGDEDDALVGVAVDPAVADRAELHETVAADDAMGDDGAMDGMDDETATTGEGGHGGGGMMQMRRVDEIPVPAGQAVALEPGGYHIMLLDLAAPLEVGSTIEVTLTFQRAGDLVVEAEVRDTAP